MDYPDLREQLVQFGRRLWERGMVAANDGNLSVRLPSGGFLATPTGVSKGFMKAADMVRLAPDGVVLSPGKPSSEIKMHLAVYAARPDVNAVVHAHPVYATSFAVAELPLDQPLVAEAVLFLGAVPVAPYGAPSTEALPRAVVPFVQKGDALLLAHHGALTLGRDLEIAYHLMETLEHVAQIVYRARQLGPLRPLSHAQLHELALLRSRYGLTGRVDLAPFGIDSDEDVS